MPVPGTGGPGIPINEVLLLKRLTAVLGYWLLSLLACAAIVSLLFMRLDVPLAVRFWPFGRILKPLDGAFGAAIILSGESVVVLAIVGARLVRGHVSAFGETLAAACLASICAYGVNDHVLKVFFGVPSLPSVLQGARHGFNLWLGSEGSSFPSGHMVLAGAFAGVFMRVDKVSIKPLAALLLLAAGLLLIGDWHFLSDIVAGTFLGISAGLLAGEGLLAHLNAARS